MSSDWPLINLNELCLKITDGAHQSPKSVSVGKPMASVKDLTRFGVDLTSARLISEEDFELLVKQGCQPIVGDVLIAKDGNSALDTVCSVDTHLEAVLLSSVAILRPDPSKINSHYLKHYLSSADVIRYLKDNFISGAAIPRVVLKDFKKALVKTPPLDIQNKIATVLNALDDRITFLRETNATLEAIAQAIFKSWFVDFDPVHANAHARAQNQNSHPQAVQQNPAPQPAEAIAQNLGLDAATAALFPDHFQDSDLGLIPAGWRVGSLADLAALNPESWTAKNKPEELAYVDLANAKENVIAEVTKYLYEDAPSRARRVLRVGDTIVGTVRPGNKSFAYIGKAEGNLTGSTGFAVLRPLAVENTEFVYLAATSEENIDYLSHVADGGAYPAVRPEVVVGVTTIVPPASCLQAFHELVAPMFSKVAENHEQSHTLTQLRDTLLPRLISGQLRLPEAEQLLAEASL